MLKMLALAVLFLSGCATPQFVASVSVRHTLASSPAAQRFAFERTASQVQSLAQRDFEADVAAELAKKGYVYAPDKLEADWLVRLNYQVDGENGFFPGAGLGNSGVQYPLSPGRNHEWRCAGALYHIAKRCDWQPGGNRYGIQPSAESGYSG